LTDEELNRYRCIVYESAKRASVAPRVSIPTLRVETTRDYDPGLPAIVQFVLTRGQVPPRDPK
jgi:hypothetical protein